MENQKVEKSKNWSIENVGTTKFEKLKNQEIEKSLNWNIGKTEKSQVEKSKI